MHLFFIINFIIYIFHCQCILIHNQYICMRRLNCIVWTTYFNSLWCSPSLTPSSKISLSHVVSPPNYLFFKDYWIQIPKSSPDYSQKRIASKITIIMRKSSIYRALSHIHDSSQKWTSPKSLCSRVNPFILAKAILFIFCLGIQVFALAQQNPWFNS